MTAFGVLSMRPLSFLSSEDLDIWGNDQIEKLQLIMVSLKHTNGKMGVRKSQQPPHPLLILKLL